MSETIVSVLVVVNVIGVIGALWVGRVERTRKRRVGVEIDAMRAYQRELERKLAVIDLETLALQWARWWARNAAESGPHDPMRALGERMALVALLCDSPEEVARATRLRAPKKASDYSEASDRNSFWIAVHREELEHAQTAGNVVPWTFAEATHNCSAIAMRRRTLLDLESI